VSAGYLMRVMRDTLPPGGRLSLSPVNRVLYVLDGQLSIEGATLTANQARHRAGACLAASAGGATALRYELMRSGAPPVSSGTLLLEHPIDLEPAAAYLMRCDRVEFDLGGEALPHRHQGGGIRCLIAGSMELRVEGQADRTLKPGEAWFESGREPVYARASADTATAFIRCAILPRAIRGQSSIVYVDPAHAGSKPRRYTVFVDEPIELP
jgi:hypothetical protein